MSSLPDDIYIDILLRLPVKSALVCKCVCKKWNSLISNPIFVKLHHNLTIQKTNFSLVVANFDFDSRKNLICSVSFDPLSLSSDEFHLYGVEIDRERRSLGFFICGWKLMCSSNSVGCIWSGVRSTFYLWDTDSKDGKELLKSPNKLMDQSFTYAFGCDSNTGDYKLVCLYKNTYGCLVDVYTTGQNSWKNTQVIPYQMLMVEQSAVLANGFFHWLGQRIDTGSGSDVIISLDISNETFEEVQPPKGLLVTPFKNVGVLKDCLCVLAYGVNVEVWVMQDYGVQESWTKRCTIIHETILKNHGMLRPIWSSKSGQILFASFGGRISELVLFDPKDGSARKSHFTICRRDAILKAAYSA